MASIQASLDSTNADINGLISQLNAANAKATSVQASLDAANASLKAVQSPRFFTSPAELTAFLAQDDTNTNPVYSGYTGTVKAFILQIQALRAGYLIAASIEWDSQYFYYGDVTNVGGVMYLINPLTDAITVGPGYGMPATPLP